MPDTQPFLEAVRSGRACLEEVDLWVERWHTCNIGCELREYLGMTAQQYAAWVIEPSVISEFV